MIGMKLSVVGCIMTSGRYMVNARFHPANASFEFGPIRRNVSGYASMKSLNVPPRIASVDPIGGSS